MSVSKDAAKSLLCRRRLDWHSQVICLSDYHSWEWRVCVGLHIYSWKSHRCVKTNHCLCVSVYLSKFVTVDRQIKRNLWGLKCLNVITYSFISRDVVYICCLSGFCDRSVWAIPIFGSMKSENEFTLRHFFGKQVLVHVRVFLRNSSQNIENSVIIYPHLLTPSIHLQMTYISFTVNKEELIYIEWWLKFQYLSSLKFIMIQKSWNIKLKKY